MSPSPVSSTPILRRTLIWSGVATAALAVVAGVVGYLVGGGEGLISGLLGVLLAALFLAITGISILIANRWYGDPLYVQPHASAEVLEAARLELERRLATLEAEAGRLCAAG